MGVVGVSRAGRTAVIVKSSGSARAGRFFSALAKRGPKKRAMLLPFLEFFFDFLDAGFGLVGLLANALEFLLQFDELLIGEALQVDHMIACAADGADQLVELEIHGFGIAILRVLDQ